MTKFIGIGSGKGGTGKTITAINLGTALHNLGKDVIVLDANLSAPNISLYLGDTNTPITFHDALRGSRHITEAGYQHQSGLRIIPGSIAYDNCRKSSYLHYGDVLLDLVGTCDMVIIDAPAGIGIDTRSILKHLDEVIIVTTPHLAAITDSMKLHKLAEEYGVAVKGAIINKVGQNKYEIGLSNIQSLLDCPILGQVPYDEAVHKSVKDKHPFVFTDPRSKASIAITNISASLVGISTQQSYSLTDKLKMILRGWSW